MKVVIIGFGLIGKKRIQALKKNEIYGIFDTNIKNLFKMKKKLKCKIFSNITDVFEDKNFDTVFISTYHNKLGFYTRLAIKYKKNILVEKPAGINLRELKQNYISSKKNKNILIHVGYNHRFHSSVILANKLIKQNKIGKLMYIRARYGHGARLNYHKEWRMNQKLSGGGELIDQGSHLIDLSRFFLGDLKILNVELRKFYWKSAVDDNAFLTLGSSSGAIAFLHCSCTEWKNKFSFEIFGQQGKIEISSIGGSYGLEELIYFKMKKTMGKPIIKKYKFAKKDLSWRREIDYFRSLIIKKKMSQSSILNALENMKIIKQSYLRKII